MAGASLGLIRPLGDVVPQYGFEHRDNGRNVVLNADTVITVPAGTYHTFYLMQSNGDKSYWNKDVGIIMYEKYQTDRAFPYVKLATLKLRKVLPGS